MHSQRQKNRDFEARLEACMGFTGAHHKVLSPYGHRTTALLRDGIIILDTDKLHHYILQMYVSNFFDQPLMMKWEKKAAAEKNYANTVSFFNCKMTSIEKYQENSGKLAKKNEFKSANVSIKIAESPKCILQDQMGSKDEELKQSKAEHLLQMSTLRTANHRQDTELKDMELEIRTLTQALTTLNNDMADGNIR